jgi:hypothetical protein
MSRIKCPVSSSEFRVQSAEWKKPIQRWEDEEETAERQMRR